jgi:glyoxylase-like metal-dependent hydrolase (beta-lactamase superfamily II)
MAASYYIHAIRYARHDRKAAANFIGGDDHATDMPLDYFVWAITGAGRTIVVDMGFDAAAAEARGRTLLRPVEEGLRLVGIDPAAVQDVIVTHMHYDHAGNIGLFPNATFHLQDDEMAFCTGRAMTHPVLASAFSGPDVQAMVGRVFAGRVRFHDGDVQFAPGIHLHRLGGHTRGLQCVRVATTRGDVLLASDAAHLYANIERAIPFPIVVDVLAYVEALRTLTRLAPSLDHIIPGHDPLVIDRFPCRPGCEGIARVDLPPLATTKETS